MKVMYKERVKSSVNPIIALVIWFFGTYVFTILWGISQILFEFENHLIMQIICLLETVWFGWFLITKVLTEIEYEIYENKLTIRKILSKRTSIVALVALSNIKTVTKDRKKCKEFHKGRIKSFVRPNLKKDTYYVVYKDEGATRAIAFSASKKVAELLK